MKRFKMKSKLSKVLLFSALVLGVASGARALPQTHALMAHHHVNSVTTRWHFLSHFIPPKTNNLGIHTGYDPKSYQNGKKGKSEIESVSGDSGATVKQSFNNHDVSHYAAGHGIPEVGIYGKRYTGYAEDSQGNQDLGSPWHFGERIGPDVEGNGFAAHTDIDEVGYHHSSLVAHHMEGDGALKDAMEVDFGQRATYKHPLNTPPSTDTVVVDYPHSAKMAIPKSYTQKASSAQSDGSSSSSQTSGTKYVRKPVDVQLTISHIKWYQPWRGHYSIVFSHNLAKGLEYNGITSMNIKYSFFYKGKQISPLDGAYLSFRNISALSGYYGSSAADEDASWNNEMYTNYEDRVYHGAATANVPAKYAYDKTGERVLPEKYANASDGTQFHQDETGVWPNQSRKGLKYSTAIRRYASNLYRGENVGGKYHWPYADSGYTGAERYGVNIPLHGSESNIVNGSSTGYGEVEPRTDIKTTEHKTVKVHNYQAPKRKSTNTRPSAQVYPVYKGIIDKRTGKLVAGERYHSDGTVEDKGNKSVATIHRPGDNNYAYIVTGRFPYRSSNNAIKTEYQQHMVQPGPQEYTYTDSKGNSTTEWYTPAPYWDGTWDKTGSQSYDAFTNDKYHLTDNLDKTSNGGYSTYDNSPTTGRNGNPYAKITNVESTGDEPSASWGPSAMWLWMNNNQMSQYNNKPFQYTIDVNAGDSSSNDKTGKSILLPHVTRHGKNQCQNTTAWGKKHRWFYWYNHAHWDAMMHNASNFDDHGRPVSHKADSSEEAHVKGQERNNSNYVPFRIRKMQYHIYHYNYNHNANDIPGSEVDTGGHNDQYHKYFKNYKMYDNKKGTESGYMRKVTGYGYQGQHIQVPILPNDEKIDKCGKQTFFQNPKYNHWRFAYDESKTMVYPVLGPDNATDEKNADNGHPSEDDASYNPKKDTMNFWKPYIIPKAKVDNGRFIVDTDKVNPETTNNLPFRLDMDMNASHWNPNSFNTDFGHTHMNLIIKDSNSGKHLYNSGKLPLTDFINESTQPKFSKFPQVTRRVRLHLKADERQEHYHRGDAIPLTVEFKPSYDYGKNGVDGNKHSAIFVKRPHVQSKGYSATEDKITGKDFNPDITKNNDPTAIGKSNGLTTSTKDTQSADFGHGNADKVTADYGHVSLIQPERTVKYFDGSPVRTQNEELSLFQNHTPVAKYSGNKGNVYPATFKTGYGVKNDLTLQYIGHLRPASYGKHGTTSNFAFPQSWADKKDTTVDYTKNNRGTDSENTPKNTLRREKDEDGDVVPNAADTMDRLMHKGSHFTSYDYEDTDPINTQVILNPKAPTSQQVKIDNQMTKGEFDSLNNSDSSVNNEYRNEDRMFNDELGQVKNNPGTYTTSYQFHPSVLNRDSGKVALAKKSANGATIGSDPLAGNNVSATDSIFGQKYNDAAGSAAINGIKGRNGKVRPINRIFTPMFLPLGQYQTVTQKAHKPDVNKFRLGGNWFDFEVGRPDTAVAHMYLADRDPGDKHSPKQFRGTLEMNNGRKSSQQHRDELAIQPALSHATNTIKGSFTHSGWGQIVAHWPWKNL